jgi:tripartite-type tricarboxylate transporter receptor subunit TctC
MRRRERRHIVNQLYRAIVTIIAQPEIRERMAALGYTPVGNPPDQCDAEIRMEIAKWAKVVRETGIKVQ